MKNILGTLAMIAILGIGIGAVCHYSGWFDTNEIQLDPEEVSVEIEQKLGKPFLKAWVERDVETLKSFLRGDFGASIPGATEWIIENKAPFEVCQRAFAEDEHESTQILDEFLGALLDQTSGIEIGQAEFSILQAPVSTRFGWDCQLLVRVTGVDKNSHVRTYQSEHEIMVNMNEDVPGSPPTIGYWEFKNELKRKSSVPIMGELEPFLRPNKTEPNPKFALDVADYDLDQDLDIVLLLENGRDVVLAFDDGKYEDVWESSGLSSADPEPQKRASAAWLDVDKDGFPDLIAGSRVFRNEQGKQFVEITNQSELKWDCQTLGGYRRLNQK